MGISAKWIKSLVGIRKHEMRWFVVGRRLEPPSDLLDGECVDVEEGLDGNYELLVPWSSDAEVLGHHLRLWLRGAEDHQPLHDVGEAQGKVLDGLPVAGT